MKKSTLIVVIAFLFCPIIWAQSIVLNGPSGVVKPESNILFMSPADADTMFISPFSISNNSLSTIRLRLRMEVISGDVYAGYSFGNWQFSRALLSESVVEIPPGMVSDNGLVTYVRPDKNSDNIVIKYTLFNEIDPAMSISFTITWNNEPEKVEDLISHYEFSNAYPNPASSNVYFNYSFYSIDGLVELKVRDLLGGEVQRVVITDNQGKLALDVNDLNSGVYFYSLIINGEPQFTRKLVVKH